MSNLEGYQHGRVSGLNLDIGIMIEAFVARRAPCGSRHGITP